MHRSKFLLLLSMIAALSVVNTGEGAAAGRAPIDAVSADCKAGNAGMCLEAGNRYRFGQDAPQDVPLAVTHYDLACKAAEPYACKALYQLGLGYRRGKDHLGRKAVEDHARAAELFGLSCAGNYGLGCTALGEAMRAGDGVEKNAARANELFALGCEKGSRWGCRYSGDALAGSDLPAATGYYEKGCRWKDSASCAALGRMHLEGRGVPRDERRAFDYFLQSCNQAPGSNDSAGCLSLARMYNAGAGTGKDSVEAVRLYRQACTVLRPKVAEACILLARAYREGDGVKPDANSAGQYFRQACGLGSGEGCREWHLDTCKRLGQPASCRWLEKEGINRP